MTSGIFDSTAKAPVVKTQNPDADESHRVVLSHCRGEYVLLPIYRLTKAATVARKYNLRGAALAKANQVAACLQIFLERLENGEIRIVNPATKDRFGWFSILNSDSRHFSVKHIKPNGEPSSPLGHGGWFTALEDAVVAVAVQLVRRGKYKGFFGVETETDQDGSRS